LVVSFWPSPAFITTFSKGVLTMHRPIDLQDHFKTALDEAFLTDFEDASFLNLVRQKASQSARLDADEATAIGV
jgi:hypothetical protein